MSDQRNLFPTGLSRSQFDRLADCAESAAQLTPTELLTAARAHLAKAQAAYEHNRMINVRLAEAIVARFKTVVDDWKRLPANERNWLAGAMKYFSTADDAEPDFGSPIGFEDDTEVLNVCLRFANLAQLCLKPEDYDDA